MIRSFVTLAASAAMAVAPIAAQAAPERVAAPVAAESEELVGNPFILPIAVAVAIALAILALSGSDDPESP